jgi:gluconokinase
MRQHPYMPASLLQSQLATLEPPGSDERALTLDIARPPDELARAARDWLATPADREPTELDRS